MFSQKGYNSETSESLEVGDKNVSKVNNTIYIYIDATKEKEKSFVFS